MHSSYIRNNNYIVGGICLMYIILYNIINIIALKLYSSNYVCKSSLFTHTALQWLLSYWSLQNRKDLTFKTVVFIYCIIRRLNIT